MHGNPQPFVSRFDWGRDSVYATRSRGRQKSNLSRLGWAVQSECEMKADQLANRLKHSAKQSAFSRKVLSRLEEPALIEPMPVAHDFELRIRKRILLMQTSHKETYSNLVALRESVCAKSRKAVQGNQVIQNQIKVELQAITCSLHQMSLLASKQRISTQFTMYSDILMRWQSLQPIALDAKSTKYIPNSNFDRSSLLSCKKQNEEEDYATLKYSEQSNFRRQHSEPLAEDDKINMGGQGYTKLRAECNNRVESNQINIDKQDDNQQQADPKLCHGLHELKDELTNGQISIRTALQTYEAVLQRLIEEIAEEKVESELSWDSVLVFTEQSFEQIVDSLAELSANSNTHDYQFDQSLNRLENSLDTNLFLQSQTRKQQEQTALKLLQQMVEGLLS